MNVLPAFTFFVYLVGMEAGSIVRCSQDKVIDDCELLPDVAIRNEI